MCGIAGIYRKDNSLNLSSHVKKMAKALIHRGPDGEVIEVCDEVGLMHRRLSIIDLEAGKQPLRDERGRLLIVNGEIYNYQELKKEFSSFPYKTHSDCEVILPLYQQKSFHFTSSLRGMFALALYDPQTRDLILARDLFGMKQLYYAQTASGFIFASEPQAILATGLILPQVNSEVRTELLQLRYTTTHETLFLGIERLLPGEMIVINEGIIKKRYRDTKNTCPKTKYSLEEALERFQTTFQDSVHVHLRSDVPCGLFLSGGLDSASLLFRMSQETDQPLKTYTIGFPSVNGRDERKQAARLSHYFKADHTEIHMDEQEFWSLLPLAAAVHDDPVFDQAIVPTYKLASIASQHVKVILSGEGGDEILAGYRRYQKVKWPSWLGGRLFRKKGLFDETPLKPFLKTWQHNLDVLQQELKQVSDSKLQHAQRIDFETWLPNNLLLKLDRCLMAHGVEGRTPYIDREIFYHFFPLSDHLKIHKGQGKWILRSWLARYVPEVEPFAKKKGFHVPVTLWMKNKSRLLSHFVAKQPGIEEFLPPSSVQEIFLKDKKNYSSAAWTLLIYALWHQRHIRGILPEGDTFTYLAK